MEIILIMICLSFIAVNTVLYRYFPKGFFAEESNFYAKFRGVDEKRKLSKKFISKSYNRKEWIKNILPIWIASLVLSNLLFKSIPIAFLLSFILAAAFIWYMKIKNQIKSKEQFLYQFREALISMANSMKSGCSLQVAIEKVKDELKHEARQKDTMIVNEFEKMVNELHLGNQFSEVLLRFKERVHMEEVDNFVNAAVITEKTGGNLTEVMINVCDMIGDRIEMKREIESLTAGKRSESKVLTIAPLILLPILALLAPSYLEPMYETMLGKILMAVAFVLLVINFIIGKKIMDIKI